MLKIIQLIEICIDNHDQEKLTLNCTLIENELSMIFQKIRESKLFNENASTFNLLNKIQFVLAKAVFKEGLEVNNVLRKFITDFDRLDDEENNKYLYSKIKSNDFYL